MFPYCPCHGQRSMLWGTYRRCAYSPRGIDRVNQLPFELLSEIFLCHMPCCSAHVMSLLLTCHHWRSVILNLPEFWATILWDLDDPNMQERYINTFLQNSRNSALNVSIRIHMTDEEEDDGDDDNDDDDEVALRVQLALQLLSTQTSRIRHLDIVASETLMPMFLPLKLSLPSLRTLAIETMNWGEEEAEVLHLRLAEEMTSLTSLTILNPSGFEPLEDVRPRLLRQLSIREVHDSPSFLPFLRACENLTTLDIDLSESRDNLHRAPKSPLWLPKLLNLHILGSIYHLFSHFDDLPQLDRLEILGRCRVTSVAHVEGRDTLPAPSLPNLRVCLLDVEDMRTVLSLLENSPKLEALQIHSARGISALLFRLIKYNRVSPNLCFFSFWPDVEYRTISNRRQEAEALQAHELDLMGIKLFLSARYRVVFELGNPRYGVWIGWWKFPLLDSLVYGLFGSPNPKRFHVVRELLQGQSPCQRFRDMLDLDASFWRNYSSNQPKTNIWTYTQRAIFL
ncbi:hypothetical protein DL93DRAFT_1563515 [Clavulina sp. PMI_390]|nr:hypothetical protein DL93DRAFT_1563515 [Clavulina sp. PMI_390]